MRVDDDDDDCRIGSSDEGDRIDRMAIAEIIHETGFVCDFNIEGLLDRIVWRRERR